MTPEVEGPEFVQRKQIKANPIMEIPHSWDITAIPQSGNRWETELIDKNNISTCHTNLLSCISTVSNTLKCHIFEIDTLKSNV